MARILSPIAIASSVVATVSDGSAFVWPTGAWVGEIEEANERDLPATKDDKPFNGFLTTKGSRISFQLGNNVGLDGQTGVGARKFFVDIALSDGDYDISTPYSEIPREAWQLSRSQLALVRLADALGQTTTEGDGEDAVTMLDPGFIDALAGGQFNGSKVGFEVRHRENKKNKDKPFADIVMYFAAP